MTWLLLTGAGFVAETVVIVALGRSTTAMTEVRAPEALPGEVVRTRRVS